MKEGWNYKKIGDIFETSSGGTPSKSHLEYYNNGKIPWLRSGEVSQGNIYDAAIYITDEGLKKSSAKIFPKNTVVIAMYGATVGQVGIIRKEMCTNQAICGVFPNENVVPEFLKYFLQSKKNKYLSLAVGGAQPNISQQIIRNSVFPYINLQEQLSIVSELDALSSIISKHKQLAEEYDRLEQSIFYDMFGDPISNEKGWKVKKLGEVGEVLGGSTPKTNNEDYWGQGYDWVTPAELNEGRYFGRTKRQITEKAVKDNNLKLFPIGTVLLSSRAPIGKVAITTHELYCNQGFKNVICGDSIHPEYICQALIEMKSFLESLGTGATFKEISKKTTEKILIPIPPLQLQTLFAKKIQHIESLKAKNAQAKKEAELLFAQRMQFYFGE